VKRGLAPNLALVALVAWGASAPTRSQVPGGAASTGMPLQQFLQVFAGEFDNRDQVLQEQAQQVAEPLRHAVAHFSLVPVRLPGLADATYIEQHRSGNPDNVTYQRLWTHQFDPASGEIVSLIHELPTDRKFRRGDLATLRPGELKPLPESCAIRWTRVGSEFRGRQSPETCRRPSGTGMRAYGDEVLLSPTEFWTNTRITDLDGKLVFGNGGGVALKMRRIAAAGGGTQP
jgi:hypothetical protein